ncbi:MAG: hypothetical protein KBA26_04670 [Candidatus Delongbacteria bacterium]|nr:hypothetical protein [Candidatus Delongbacteria bacterium]
MLKRIIFSLIVLILFILMLEGVSRIIYPVGSADSLFVSYTVKGVEYRLSNRFYPRRYFFLPDAIVPTLSPELMIPEKSPGVYRVFCLGESTTAGFPYQFNISYPFFLKQILQHALPERTIEVINLGVSAINSYAVSDMLPDLQPWEPDLVLLYLGHNEFYGSFGTASTQYRWGGYNLKKLYLRLLDLRSVSFFKHLLLTLSRGDTPIGDQSLMSHLISARRLRHDEPVFRETLSDYQRNLDQIVNFCRDHHWPLLVSTLISNTRDFAPFSSYHGRDFGADDSSRWEESILKWRRSGTRTDSLEALNRLVELDSVYADVRYERARLTGNAADYQAALDYDAIRFRAPSGINAIIKNYHDPENRIWVLDLDAHLRSFSPGGEIGNEWMTEHLHPNREGYWEMARYYAGLIIKQFFTESSRDLPDRSPVMGYTDLDLYAAHKTIENLTRQAPYRRQILLYPELTDRPDTPLMDTLSTRFLSGRMSWADYHLSYGRFLYGRKEDERAGHEFMALFDVFPQYPEYLMEAGDSLVLHDNNSQAMAFYEKAFAADSTLLEALAKIGSLYYFEGEYPLAAERFEKLIRMNRSMNKLKPEDCIRVHRFQLDCCLKLGLREEALEEIRVLTEDLGQSDHHLFELRDRIRGIRNPGSR